MQDECSVILPLTHAMFKLHDPSEATPLQKLLKTSDVAITESGLHVCDDLLQKHQRGLNAEAAIVIQAVMAQLSAQKTAYSMELVKAHKVVQTAYDKVFTSRVSSGQIEIPTPTWYTPNPSRVHDWHQKNPFLSLMVNELLAQLGDEYNVETTLPYAKESHGYESPSEYIGGNLVIKFHQ